LKSDLIPIRKFCFIIIFIYLFIFLKAIKYHFDDH